MINIKTTTSLILLISIGSIFTIAYPITITNNSTNPIAVIFQAAGCFGMSLDQSVVCKSDQAVSPGSSASYTWKWGQSSKKVKIKDSDYLFQLTKDPTKGTYSWTGYAGDKEKDEAWRNTDIAPKNKKDFKYIGSTVGI